MSRIYLALGANLGDARGSVLRAIERLRSFSAEPLAASSLWKTEPVGCPPGSAPFINAVVALAALPGETPEALLAALQRLEMEFGRVPKHILNEPRPLDVDIIAFGGETRATPKLTLPHPRAHQRRFVLAPLAEIAPDLVLPGQTLNVAALLERLPAEPAAERLG